LETNDLIGPSFSITAQNLITENVDFVPCFLSNLI
jgi:hypothetical protein